MSLSVEALTPGCGCGDGVEALQEVLARIEAAPSVEEAREVALAETRLASAALGRARVMLPWSGNLSAAHDRLASFQDRVLAAATPGGVAAEFGDFMRLDAPRADVDADCEYTTGEIIAIVLGFILGIIPGLILLILLC